MPPPFVLSDFLRGLGRPFRGAAYLFSHRGLKRYAVLPLIANILLYALCLALFFHFLWNWQIGLVAWDFWGPVGRWLSAAVNWSSWTLKLLAAAAALAVSFFTFTAVGMVLASPLNDMLSEKVETSRSSADGRLDLPFRFTIKAAVISLGDSLTNLVKQLFWTAVALPLLLIPVVGFLPLLLVGAYFAGFGFLDSSMARNYLRPRHKRLLSDRRFWEILGFGVAMQAAFAIPFLGILILPVGVTSGTLMYCDADWDGLLAEAGLERPEGFTPPGESPAGQTPD